MQSPKAIEQNLIDDLPQKLAPVVEAVAPYQIKPINRNTLDWLCRCTLDSDDIYGGRVAHHVILPLPGKWAWKYPKQVDALLGSLIESTISFLSLQASAGADALMLFDSWASAVPAAQRDWLVTRPARLIIERLRKNGHKQPVIGFPKGIGEGLIAYVDTVRGRCGWSGSWC